MFILIPLLYALIALTFPLAQLTLAYAHPLLIITLRMLIAGTVFLIFTPFRALRGIIDPDDKWLFAQVAFFHIYLAFIPEFWALQYLSALKVNIIYCASPFISALLEILLLGVAFSSWQLFGMLLGASGILFLTVTTARQECFTLTCPYPYVPELALLVAVASAAYAWFLIKKLLGKGYPLTYINGIAMFWGGLLSAVSLLFVEEPFVINNVASFALSLGALIIVANFMVYQLYGSLLRYYQPTFLSLMGFLSPIFGSLYAYFLFGETISWHYWMSFTLIVVGLTAFYKGGVSAKKA